MSAKLLIHLECDNRDSCEEKLVVPGDPRQCNAQEEAAKNAWVTVVHNQVTRHFCRPACAGRVLAKESSLVEVN